LKQAQKAVSLFFQDDVIAELGTGD
jgi:hypothetical protein